MSKFVVSVVVIYVIAPHFVYAAEGVHISKVLFNPAGIDTGLEYVILKNTGDSDMDLTDWDLYPDGVGYYTFTGLILAAGKQVKIHLRRAGDDSDTDLYHESATSNMGNTSGSIALFSGIDHNAESIIDFVQYGRSGETWESAADAAGIWRKGDAIDIDETEDKVLRRVEYSHGALSWSYGLSEQAIEPELAEIKVQSENNDEIKSDLGGGGIKYVPPERLPTIKAYAGEDIMAVAGAEILFNGRAFGWEDEPLESDTLRFFWNFGDGTLKDGRNIRHAYEYPGLYTVILQIVQSNESDRDDLKVRVSENPVRVSEIFPGHGGWIELANPSAKTVDISRWSVKNLNGKIFVFPDNSYLTSNSFTVFTASTTSLMIGESNLGVSLHYPNGKEASRLFYEGTVGENLSITTDGYAVPTPGMENQKEEKKSGPKKEEIMNEPDIITQGTTAQQAEVREVEEVIGDPEIGQEALASVQLHKSSNYMWLGASITAGFMVGSMALIYRRKFVKDQ
jgi:hypothetical protein